MLCGSIGNTPNVSIETPDVNEFPSLPGYPDDVFGNCENWVPAKTKCPYEDCQNLQALEDWARTELAEHGVNHLLLKLPPLQNDNSGRLIWITVSDSGLKFLYSSGGKKVKINSFDDIKSLLCPPEVTGMPTRHEEIQSFVFYKDLDPARARHEQAQSEKPVESYTYTSPLHLTPVDTAPEPESKQNANGVSIASRHLSPHSTTSASTGSTGSGPSIRPSLYDENKTGLDTLRESVNNLYTTAKAAEVQANVFVSPPPDIAKNSDWGGITDGSVLPIVEYLDHLYQLVVACFDTPGLNEADKKNLAKKFQDYAAGLKKSSGVPAWLWGIRHQASFSVSQHARHIAWKIEQISPKNQAPMPTEVANTWTKVERFTYKMASSNPIVETTRLTIQKNDNGGVTVNMCLPPPEEITISGAGSKGAGYFGCLEALQDRELLSNIKRVKGTSAGAITACLVAAGVSLKDIDDFIQKSSPQMILGEKSHSPDTKLPIAIVRAIWNKGSTAPVLREEIDTLLCKAVLENLNEIAINKNLCSTVTNIKCRLQSSNPKERKLTFKDLDNLHRAFPEKFKDLEIFATKIKVDIDEKDPDEKDLDDGELVCISASTFPDMPISDGVFSSMSLPYIYRKEEVNFGGAMVTLADGGFILNSPTVFDRGLLKLKTLDPFCNKPVIFGFFEPNPEGVDGIVPEQDFFPAQSSQTPRRQTTRT